MKLVTALLLIVVAAPAPEMRYFKYQRAVLLPPGSSGQSCSVLDASTFTHASRDLADLRLYRDGVETPFVIQQAAGIETPAQTLNPLNLGERSGHTVFDVAMPDTTYSDVQIGLDGRDFLATVTVSGSQKSGGAATRIGDYTVFDLSSQKLGRSTVLHLPKSNFRYLHFALDKSISPHQIGRVSIASQPVSEPHYINVLASPRFRVQGHDSVAEFAAPGRVPIDQIVFFPSADPVNFSREVDIQVAQAHPATDSPDSMSPVTSSGSLRRIHRSESGHRIDDEQLSVPAPQVAFDGLAKWTITIHNGDDAPIQFDRVNVEMRERSLCFEASNSAQYTLFYGDQALSAPHYDYAAWFSAQAPEASAALGPEQANPGYQARPDQRPFTERHPALLWLALLLIVLLLGLIALRSAKRVEPPVLMP